MVSLHWPGEMAQKLRAALSEDLNSVPRPSSGDTQLSITSVLGHLSLSFNLHTMCKHTNKQTQEFFLMNLFFLKRGCSPKTLKKREEAQIPSAHPVIFKMAKNRREMTVGATPLGHRCCLSLAKAWIVILSCKGG